ncbi:FAD binding domain-containing protein [Larsenimonas rhizosphaerae]|uniref:Xanthine dehydrogenase family protein subunit M n=1 Tax=Larsenimonas rhizosphaerae TaxID=2944682 RepID=A0AA42CUF4_9GAMM|nr:xanthine dehydrogenase family protein subunit M [Larsenimonas rhizosphaerae]MCX2524269.1 xanthine dehydrogenase family protein subunit M [Larsenimonas rhizosphaerae]
MRAFDYTRPGAVDAAIATHARANSAYLAGGTTLLDLAKINIMQPDQVVDINGLGLDHIERLKDGRVQVGALVTNTALARHELIETHYPVLSQALLSGASTQLRNKATTAGNVMQRVRCPYFRDGTSPCNKRDPGSGCAAIGGVNRETFAVLGTSDQCIAAHPSDMCVAMAAIGATVSVMGPNGPRDIPFDAFHLLPGTSPAREHALEPDELITHVTLDAPPGGARSGYLKLRDRASYQFALASCAAQLSVEGGVIRAPRIALGGVATKPWRATDAERMLDGKVPSRALFEQAASAAFNGATAYEHNAFKIPLGRHAIIAELGALTGLETMQEVS